YTTLFRSGELQDRRRLDRTSQFCVHDGVAHLSLGRHLTEQEVRAAVEPAVEESRLEDHVCAPGDGGQGAVGMLPQAGFVVAARHLDLHHAGTEALAILGQHPGLMLVTEPCGTFSHRVTDLEARAAP